MVWRVARSLDSQVVPASSCAQYHTDYRAMQIEKSPPPPIIRSWICQPLLWRALTPCRLFALFFIFVFLWCIKSYMANFGNFVILINPMID